MVGEWASRKAARMAKRTAGTKAIDLAERSESNWVGKKGTHWAALTGFPKAVLRVVKLVTYWVAAWD